MHGRGRPLRSRGGAPATPGHARARARCRSRAWYRRPVVDSSAVGKALIVVGLLVVAVGAVLLLGGLPGDIAVKRGNFRFSFPLATCLALSLLLTLALALLNRR